MGVRIYCVSWALSRSICVRRRSTAVYEDVTFETASFRLLRQCAREYVGEKLDVVGDVGTGPAAATLICGRCGYLTVAS